MSHIFISYAHDDRKILDQVVSWFQDRKNNEISLWYDNNIGGGTNWRDEIAQALDGAFAVIVIVTRASNESRYCTYEWAYAMGQGIPIIPLSFEDLTITELLPPLATRQIIDCTNAIPEHLYEQVRQLRSESPQLEAINRKVFDIIYDTHRRFFILGWMGDVFGSFSNDDFKDDTLGYFIEKSRIARNELESVIVNNSITMTAKQYRYCWKIADFLKEFSRLHRKYETYFYERLFAKFDSEWLPAFEYFEGDGYWNRWKQRQLDWIFNFDTDRPFSEGLRESAELEIIMEIGRVFPYVSSDEISMVIQNKRPRKLDE